MKFVTIKTEFDDVEASFSDGIFCLHGIRDALQELSGLGGGFRYCRLDTPLFNEFGDIDGGVTFPDLAAHVFFCETVSATARRHGISRSQLTAWRELAREGRLIDGSAAAPCDAPTFTPVVLAADPPAAPSADLRIEIALCNGRRLLVGAEVDPAAVVRLVDALDRR